MYAPQYNMFEPPIRPGSPFRIDKYFTSGQQLGQGAYAHVYKGTNEETGEVVAIKEINCTQLLMKSPKLQKHLDKEIEIMVRMAQTRDDNIVTLHCTKTLTSQIHGTFVYLVLDYCDEDLHKYLSKKPLRRVTESEAKQLLVQFANGLAYLRNLEITHRDLKTQNILVKYVQGRPVLKIADFGFARYIEPQGMAETLCGTPLYMAPEILNRDKYTSKADLWSVGVILYEMVCGTTPFNAHSLEELTAKLRKAPITFPPSIQLSNDCKNLIMRLLQRDHALRISWDEFFIHPFFAPNYPKKPITSQAVAPLQTVPVQPAVIQPIIRPPAPPVVNLFKNSPSLQELNEYRAAVAVAKLGLSYEEDQQPGKALSLYIKALQTLSKLYSKPEQPFAQEISTTFKSFFDRMLRLSKEVRPEGIAEPLIFDAARRCGQEGAVKEVSKSYHESREHYLNGYYLLFQLHSDIQSERDKAIVQEYLNRFSTRLEIVNAICS